MTSPRASARIATDLRKLTVASRMNVLGSSENPLTASEHRTLEVARQAITQEFQVASGPDISAAERDEIFRRIHVISLAVEPSLVWQGLTVIGPIPERAGPVAGCDNLADWDASVLGVAD